MKKPLKTLKEYKDIYAVLSLIAAIGLAATLVDRLGFRGEAAFEASGFDSGVALLSSFLLHFAVFLFYDRAWEASGRSEGAVLEKRRRFAAVLRIVAFVSALWYGFCVSLKIFGFIWLII